MSKKRKLQAQQTPKRSNNGKPKLKVNVTYVAIAAVVLIFLGGIAWSASATPSGPVGGKPAPDFTGTDLAGNRVSLQDFRGKPVLLNMWASWCPPCKQEVPELEEFYKEYAPKGVAVLTVNMNEDKATVASFVAQQKVTFPVVLDESGKIGELYHVDGIPASFFIDKDGILRAVRVGGMTKTEMINRISTLMQQ